MTIVIVSIIIVIIIIVDFFLTLSLPLVNQPLAIYERFIYKQHQQQNETQCYQEPLIT